jgi:hypothetical protein
MATLSAMCVTFELMDSDRARRGTSVKAGEFRSAPAITGLAESRERARAREDLSEPADTCSLSASKSPSASKCHRE